MKYRGIKSSLTRRQQAAIERLETAERNENAHTRQVTALALALFDAVRKPWKFTADDRRMLELAARLHDLGYARAPLDHARASADLVLRNRTLGLSSARRRALAALILLHGRGDYRKALRNPVFRRLPRPQRVLRLGALLRVADGLDNGHVQDAVITRTQLTRRKLKVEVRTPAWRYNLCAARRKADLWRAVLPARLQLKEKAGPRRWRLVHKRLDSPEAARRLLSLEYRAFMATREETRRGKAEPLHQARIALRRCRILLRAFGPALPAAAARAARQELARVSEVLGRVRDLDVWQELLPAGSSARALLARRRSVARRRVTIALSGASLDAVRRAMGCLLRTELAQPLIASSLPAAGALATKSVRDAARRARKRGRNPGDTMAARHRLRAALRRVLLLGRVLAPLLRKSIRRSSRDLREAEQALGRLHDLESLCAAQRGRLGHAALRRRCARELVEVRRQLASPALRRAFQSLR